MTGKDRRLGQNAELRQQVEEMLRNQGVPSSPVGDVQGGGRRNSSIPRRAKIFW